MFRGAEKISEMFLKSNLYIQYHCLARTRNVNRLDSLCHSINFNIKLELIKMLIHHPTGIMQVSKSPHLPCGRNVEAILGLNFKVLYLKTRATNK
jgi:hypothetical protein